VLQDAARLTDDVTKLMLDRLQMRADPLPAGSLKCTEQLIASRIVSLSYSYGNDGMCDDASGEGRDPAGS